MSKTAYDNADPDFAKWAKKFEPIAAPDGDADDQYAGCLRGFNDPDISAKMDSSPDGWLHVWTLLECDGRYYISAGHRFVNREGYFLCAKPHDAKAQAKDIRL